MPGMTGGPSATTATLAAAFKLALLSQGTVVFLIFVMLAIAWVTCREVLLASARPQLTARLAAIRASRGIEPAPRRLLRIGFGLLWIFDGLLQAQPAMPAGLPSEVSEPAAAGSPGWVLHLVTWAGAAWSYHPVQAAVGAVWIQLGIGIWLISAASPRWSRLAGLVSLGWGLAVWIFGEALGSMLAPGQSWLTGAPGSALFYCAAGILLALPIRHWHDARLGARVLQASGLLMIAFAVLQAWPGRGFWQGRQHGQPGSLTSAINAMTALRQPAALHSLVRWSGSLAASHGFAVNLVAVIVLAATGACLLTGRLGLVRLAVIAAIAFCLADWVLVQDLGFVGGLGTDPNSMLPQALILAVGLGTMSAVPATATAADCAPVYAAVRTGWADAASTGAGAGPGGAGLGGAGVGLGGRARQLSGRAVRGLGLALGTASTSAVLTLWAAAMVILGAAPLVLAARPG
jgi:hypothetical protein